MKDYSKYKVFKVTYLYKYGKPTITLVQLSTKDAIHEALKRFETMGYNYDNYTITCKQL